MFCPMQKHNHEMQLRGECEHRLGSRSSRVCFPSGHSNMPGRWQVLRKQQRMQSDSLAGLFFSCHILTKQQVFPVMVGGRTWKNRIQSEQQLPGPTITFTFSACDVERTKHVTFEGSVINHQALLVPRLSPLPVYLFNQTCKTRV